MPTAEYARDRLVAAIRPPASGADYCVSLAGSLGRYWSSLLHPLTADNRTVAVVGHLPKPDYYDPHGLGRIPLQLPRVTFSTRLPRRTESTILLTDEMTAPLTDRSWAKVLRVSDATETPISDAGTYYRLPYPMYPGYVARGWESRFIEQRTAVRTTRMLFAGTTASSYYDARTDVAIRRQHGLELTRTEAVGILTGALTSDELTVVEEGNGDPQWAFDGACADRMLLVAWSAYRDERWVRVLGSAAFFLALPGVFIPTSHNVIEAMAAGCIPVLSYSGWFSPALTDGVNCLVYSDAASLVDVVRRALAMSPAEIEKLRTGARDYYDTYLAPSVVPQHISELPDRVTVFVQTENSDQTATIRRGSVGFPG